MAKQAQRTGLTLIEFLVVVVIIAVIIGMLLPATRQVRDAARRTACQNNLRQLGIASHSYEAAHGRFPMGVGVTDQDGVLQAQPLSGVVSLLPYIEMNALYDEISQPMTIADVDYPAFEAALDDANYLPWTTEIDVLICLSSSHSDGDWGRTSYGFSIGDVARNVSQQETLRGPFGYFKAIGFDDITDGNSNTIAMLEIGNGTPQAVKGGCLADGKADWLDNPKQRFTEIEDGKYPSEANLIDRGSHWADGRAGVGLINTILPANSPSFQVQDSPTGDGIYSAGSNHPGGCNVLLLDASTRFVSEEIDTGGSAVRTLTIEQMVRNVPSPHGVWGALGTIASEDDAEHDGF